MDFAKFDQRGAAEKGAVFPILHPETGKEITGDNGAAEFILRGTASRTVQAILREKQIELMDGDETDVVVMEDVHKGLVDAAMPFILGFSNVERDGKPLTVSEDDVRWFLDLTFPVMSVDEEGKPVMANNPFAKQVIDNVSKHEKFLGKD